MSTKEQEAKLDEARAELIKKLDLHNNDFHKLSTEDAYKKHKTDPKKGLSSAQVAELQKKFGKNELEAEEDKTLFEKIME